MVLTAFFIALGVVLPMALHSIPKAGTIFLPMHIPVLFCGFVCGPIFGVLCGISAVTISAFTTGMPPMSVYPGMLVELILYGFFTGFFLRLFKFKNKYINVYISLILSMLIGRAGSGLVNGLILHTANYSFIIWVTASFVTALPGIIIQLSLIPILYLSLENAHLINITNENIFGFINHNKTAKNTRNFFDKCAKNWDETTNISEGEIASLLECCKFAPGEKVLDLACGTGILEPYLINKNVDLVCLDISKEMISIAKNKFKEITYINQDFYNFIGKSFDKIIVFNAYPHFTDREAFVDKCYELLNSNGQVFIIHNESKEKINSYHVKSAKNVSLELLSANEESLVFKNKFDIIETKDNHDGYLIVARKK